jgi:hypothetical protein
VDGVFVLVASLVGLELGARGMGGGGDAGWWLSMGSSHTHPAGVLPATLCSLFCQHFSRRHDFHTGCRYNRALGAAEGYVVFGEDGFLCHRSGLVLGVGSACVSATKLCMS